MLATVALWLCAEQIEKKVRELYEVVCRLEDEKYDWEMKLIRQNAEVTSQYCSFSSV